MPPVFINYDVSAGPAFGLKHLAIVLRILSVCKNFSIFKID